MITPGWSVGFAGRPAESSYPKLWRGLLGAWVPAFGPTGATLFDVSGYRYHAALQGFVWAIPSRNLNHQSLGWTVYLYHFTGRGLVGDHARFDLTGNTVAISAWVMPRIYKNDAYVLSKMGSGGANGYALRLHNGKLEFLVGDGTWRVLTSNGYYTTNNWYHIVGQYNQGTLELYINGKLDSSAGPFGNLAAAAQPLTIGAYNTAFFSNFYGHIPMVSLYDRPLFRSEILDLYRDPLGMFRRSTPAWASPGLPVTVGSPGVILSAGSRRSTLEAPVRLGSLATGARTAALRAQPRD